MRSALSRTILGSTLPLLLLTPSCTVPPSSHLTWQSQRAAALQAEDGWLSLVGLDFLSDGNHTIGSSPSSTFPYPHCARACVGTLTVVGDTVRFTPDGEGATATTTLVADDQGAPSVIRSGSVSFTLVRRNGKLALRVRDSLSPVRTGFAGIHAYPYDPSMVVQARVAPSLPDSAVAITNVLGFTESQPVRAVLEFELSGAHCRLTATAGSGDRLFVVFADSTSGGETYGGGRFLDLDAPSGGLVTIDFNRSYNPPCSFTPYATCPLPPEGNRLSIPIRAGELAAK